MTVFIRVTKISGIPIESNSVMKAVQVTSLGSNSSDIFSFCRITPNPNNKYESIIESDKIWEIPIDQSEPPYSIVIRLLNMEPTEMEIQRLIISSAWFKIDTYISEFFPLKPMVPCLPPAVANIDIHFVSVLPSNQIFTPFGCEKGEMAIYPRWRSIKPFIPSNLKQPQDIIDDNDNNNKNANQFMNIDNDELHPLNPDDTESTLQQAKQAISNLIRRTRSNSVAKSDKDIMDFPNVVHHDIKKLDSYYIAFEKYSFDEKTLQQKYEEFEKGISQVNNQRRASQTQIHNHEKKKHLPNQTDPSIRRESLTTQNKSIPVIHNRKQNADEYKFFD